MTRSDPPKPPAVAIVRQNGMSSASCRASVAVTPVSRQIWWIQVVGGRHWHISTPARAGHHPSSWYRFEGSGLPVHHFEVWRRDQTDRQHLKQCFKYRGIVNRLYRAGKSSAYTPVASAPHLTHNWLLFGSRRPRANHQKYDV